ncbi:MAG: ATP-binding cassette, subfamily B, bacterial [Parcubacteria group bacterium Gr01-1014_24]|nr:MAG: ATP-binding cassette, subfamily B, bacterial [Parcubacteria group bacterium Gr01-1014_24]
MFSLFAKILKYIWPPIRKRQWVFYFILVFYTARVFFDQVAVPFYFKKIIDVLSQNDLSHSAASDDVFRLLFIIIGIHVSVFFVARITKFILLKFEAEAIRDLRDFTFQRVERNSHTFFANTFAGSLVTKARRFVGGFETVFDTFFYNFWKFFVLLTGVFVILIFQAPVISVIFGVWIVVHMGVVFLMLKRKISYDLTEAEQDSRISGRLADVFSNISAVKFFSASKNEVASFGEYTKEGEKRSKRAWFMGGKMDLVQHLMIITVEIAILYAMIVLWFRGEISTGTIVLVQTYMVVIANNLWEFGNSLVRFMKSISDMKEMVDIFEITPDILDPKNPETLKMHSGHIVFKNVSFEYQNGREVFRNFNLDIKPGERVGLVGHSGAGKSTITSLVLRFVDVVGGNIIIDGQDIRKVKQDDLRSVISYVPQESVLFHRTIRENIAYGKPSAKAKDEEIISAAQKAHADEFISKLHKGYGTFVGERGVKLSGGERQRIAIARAMLKDAPILILDEATSSLDSISESYIQDAFSELMKGKTTLVIAHRLSTIQKMDRIIVLEKGQIVEEGTHQELLEKNNLYADLWNHQTGGFLE